MKYRHFLFCIVFTLGLPLISCHKNGETPASSVLKVSGAKSSVFATLLTAKPTSVSQTRPGASLGMYVSIYLTQRMMMGTASALEGIDTQIHLARADSIIEDETFTLLQEYGTVLQVNIIDTLNRSVDREKTLDKYTLSLTQMNTRIVQKQTELKQKLDDIGEKRKVERKEVRDMERMIKDALREKDYVAAGPIQKGLALKEAKLAGTESLEKQTDKVLDIVKDLLEVGEERLQAIIKNREILIAGLQVIDVPGIQELGIVIEE